MTRRTVWAASTGSYSSYSVTALFEDKADAEAVAARTHGHHYDDSFVEEFELYSSGDRSRRDGPVWIAEVTVREDATLIDRDAQLLERQTVDDDGPVADLVSVERRSYRYPLSRDGGYRVTGRGLTEAQAVKGAKDRAAQVAAMILDGVDPREIMHGAPSFNDIDAAHEIALADEAMHQRDRERAAEDRRQAAARAKMWNRRVGLFDGDIQVGVWVRFDVGYIPLPAEFDGDPYRLKLRDEYGASVPDAQVGEVLHGGGRPTEPAVMWPRTIAVPAIQR